MSYCSSANWGKARKKALTHRFRREGNKRERRTKKNSSKLVATTSFSDE